MEFLTYTTGLAALAVVLVHEVLKLKIVPIAIANKYPVPVNIILSIGAAIVVTWQSSIQPTVWTQWVALVATISVVAAIVYNMVLAKWSQLREMEG